MSDSPVLMRAFLAGRAVRQSGLGVGWCPHRREGDPLREAWLAGWQARDDEILALRGECRHKPDGLAPY